MPLTTNDFGTLDSSEFVRVPATFSESVVWVRVFFLFLPLLGILVFVHCQQLVWSAMRRRSDRRDECSVKSFQKFGQGRKKNLLIGFGGVSNDVQTSRRYSDSYQTDGRTLANSRVECRSNTTKVGLCEWRKRPCFDALPSRFSPKRKTIQNNSGARPIGLPSPKHNEKSQRFFLDLGPI